MIFKQPDIVNEVKIKKLELACHARRMQESMVEKEL